MNVQGCGGHTKHSIGHNVGDICDSLNLNILFGFVYFFFFCTVIINLFDCAGCVSELYRTCIRSPIWFSFIVTDTVCFGGGGVVFLKGIG